MAAFGHLDAACLPPVIEAVHVVRPDPVALDPHPVRTASADAQLAVVVHVAIQDGAARAGDQADAVVHPCLDAADPPSLAAGPDRALLGCVRILLDHQPLDGHAGGRTREGLARDGPLDHLRRRVGGKEQLARRPVEEELARAKPGQPVRLLLSLAIDEQPCRAGACTPAVGADALLRAGWRLGGGDPMAALAGEPAEDACPAQDAALLAEETLPALGRDGLQPVDAGEDAEARHRRGPVHRGLDGLAGQNPDSAFWAGRRGRRGGMPAGRKPGQQRCPGHPGRHAPSAGAGARTLTARTALRQAWSEAQMEAR